MAHEPLVERNRFPADRLGGEFTLDQAPRIGAEPLPELGIVGELGHGVG
jgi:hypothetical protein